MSPGKLIILTVATVFALDLAASPFNHLIDSSPQLNLKDDEEEPAVFVEYADIGYRDIRYSVSTSAQLLSPRIVEISARTAETVVDVYAEMGDTVKAGQVLASLDSTALELRAVQARAALKRARHNLQTQEGLARRHFDERRALELAGSEVENALLNLQKAELKLDHTRIVAPFDGVISSRTARQGMWAGKDLALFQIVDRSALEFRFSLPENQAGLVAVGMPVNGRIISTGAHFQSRILRLSPVINDAKGVREMRGTLETSASLRSGMYAEIVITYQTSPHVLAVPSDGIIYLGGDPYVFVIINNRSILREIKTREPVDGYAEIVWGLHENDRIATAGKRKLDDKQLLTTEQNVTADTELAGN